MSGYGGLTTAEKQALARTLAGDCWVRREVTLRGLGHTLVSDISDLALDGQVNYTPGDGVSRTLQMGFLDPDHSLRLDAEAPSQGVAGLNRLIRVTMSVYVPDFSQWYGVHAFTGRPSQVDRDGDTVTVEAQGKECLHLRTVSSNYLRKGTYLTNAIKHLLTIAGETHFRFPPGKTGGKLPERVNFGGTDEARQPWQVARRLARRMGYRLDYDGSGYAWLRKVSASPALTLVEAGDGANVTARVRVGADLKTMRNRVVATGRTKKGKALYVTPETPKASHPHSGQSLKINGVPWFNTAIYDQPGIKKKSDLIQFQRARLKELLTENVTVQTTAFPYWHLDPGDLIRFEGASATFNFRFSEGSVPLGPSDSGMTIGYTHPVRNASAGRIRR